ncbi:M23 family metallopeptidase [Poseidonibacter lekithochrous]|uniref:M23 family metallopeptidase n=1 Tax=Poseidonibacter lekithochrous TaxID=1904463 RepID=UPI0008FCAAA3|nr:M23 family metallopeptidase [Poseidonibacter lekithochrous]QKJ21951.1 zinc metallopeptidase, M23 family [Poseidonibacter lekithochrous]
MRNRLIITISDVKGTKSYNLHQFVKKILLIAIILIVMVLGGSFLFISYLNGEIDEAQEDKKAQLKLLAEKEEKLVAQNKFYSVQIKSKVQDIEELSSKLDEIHTIIGVGKDATAEEISKKTLKNVNLDLKKYTLRVIPNGKPIAKIRVSSGFGYRINPITKKRQFHRGLDIPTKRKTPIRATADGVVEYVQSKNVGAYGRVVRLSHNFGFQTVFAHMNKTLVKVGSVIKKGQIIGLSGNSGRSSGPHVHYEVRYATKVLNPRNFIKWDLKNYNYIFKKERRVEWESLINQIKDQHQMGQQ